MTVTDSDSPLILPERAVERARRVTSSLKPRKVGAFQSPNERVVTGPWTQWEELATTLFLPKWRSGNEWKKKKPEELSMCICLDYVRLVTPNAISNAIPCVNPKSREFPVKCREKRKEVIRGTPCERPWGSSR